MPGHATRPCLRIRRLGVRISSGAHRTGAHSSEALPSLWRHLCWLFDDSFDDSSQPASGVSRHWLTAWSATRPRAAVGRIGEHGQLRLLPDAGELVAHVINRDAHHEFDRFESAPCSSANSLIDRSDVKTCPACDSGSLATGSSGFDSIVRHPPAVPESLGRRIVSHTHNVRTSAGVSAAVAPSTRLGRYCLGIVRSAGKGRLTHPPDRHLPAAHRYIPAVL